MTPLDCVIIGGGPAGCSAATWAAQLGLAVALVERASQPCATLGALDFEQDWVLGHGHTSLAAVGRAVADHAQSVPGVHWHLGSAAVGLDRPDGHWRVALADGR
ncbi:MAG TPA: FAD-dependent oxidoreductase, partial [Burkholderiaceae bacterium]|nr:FAD-dependent oxidoreductase [Burkholderiaceae bacterium]